MPITLNSAYLHVNYLCAQLAYIEAACSTLAPLELLALDPKHKLHYLSVMTQRMLLTCSEKVDRHAYWHLRLHAVSNGPMKVTWRTSFRGEGAHESKMRSRLWDSDAPALREQIKRSGPSSSTLAVTPTRSPSFASRDRVAWRHKADT